MKDCNEKSQSQGNREIAILEDIDHYILLVRKIESTRTALLNHPVYKQLGDLTSLQIFMESHIFAIWDFMSLIKTLQRRVTCLDVPWLPPTDINSARMVNEIVLAEETDEVTPERYTSHFDLYLTAMEEIGADSSSIRKFIYSLRQGFSVVIASSVIKSDGR